MLDGLWEVFLSDGTYVGYYETDVAEKRLLVDKKVFDQTGIGTHLFLLGKYDHRSLEVSVNNRYRNTLIPANCLEIKVIRKELTADEKATLVIPKPVNERKIRIFG